MPAPKKQTISAIATEIGEDSARVRKVVKSLGYIPTGKNAHNADLYSLTKAQKKQLREASQAAKTGGESQQELGLNLKDEELKQKIKKLKLQNRLLEGNSTANTVVSEIFAGLISFQNTFLRQKLLMEIPISCAGLDPADIREKINPIYDDILEKTKAELEKWERVTEERKASA